MCVAVLLTVNLAKIQPLQSTAPTDMSQIRRKLHQHQLGEPAKARYRRMDLDVRREYFARLRFARTGGRLLAGLIALAAASGLVASKLARRIKVPAGPADLSAEQIQVAARSRWATAAFAGVLIAAAGVLIAASGEIISPELIGAPGPAEQDGTPPQEPYYPTPQQVAANWPRFRGPTGNGVAVGEDFPDSWDGDTGDSVLWRQFVPLGGQSSPVVWVDRVFLTGADRTLREVYCYDAATGKLLWQKALDKIPGTPPRAPDVSSDTGFAAPTAVTDGKRVYAIFANGDLAAIDFEGNQVWGRNLGTPKNMYGYATSLVMYRNILFVQYDQGDEEDDLSELIAFEGRTGKQLWAVKRQVSDSWATPIIASTPSGDQLITCARPWVIAYEPVTGKEIWKVRCLEGDVAPSPIFAGGFVFAVAPNMTIYAIRPDGQGDVTDTHIAWQAEDGVPDITSPVSNGKVLALLTTQGLLTCYSVSDGVKLYEHQFEGTFMSSPTFAAGRFYVLDHEGLMYVLEAGREFKLIATSKLGQKSTCSPAFVGGRIYIRGEEDLYCIGSREE